MTAAARRGPYAKSAARRAEIVKAARESFVENGFDAASLRDIAERAGMSHAGLLHHFATKEELLLAVLADRDAEEERASHAPQLPAQPSAADFGDILTRLVREHQQAPELIRLWTELAAAASRPEHPAHSYFTDRFRLARELHGGYWADRDGENVVSPSTAAMLTMAVLDGLQLQWLLQPELDIVEPLRAFLQLLHGQRPSA